MQRKHALLASAIAAPLVASLVGFAGEHGNEGRLLSDSEAATIRGGCTLIVSIDCSKPIYGGCPFDLLITVASGIPPNFNLQNPTYCGAPLCVDCFQQAGDCAH